MSFQSAYERFVSDPGAAPDPPPAVLFHHARCLFFTPTGVQLYAEQAHLRRHFEDVMHDVQSKRYLRTVLGPPQVTLLGTRPALLSIEIARLDVDQRQYDEDGVTYTFHRNKQGDWQIAVVTTHPAEAVIHEAQDTR